MTPKEKAKELYSKMQLDWACDSCHNEWAKECALIAVEEVRFFHDRLFYATEGSIFDKYLNEVKQEIEKL